METGSIIKIAMITAGIMLMLFSFWFLAAKKITVNFAAVWEIVGGLLVIMGVFLWHRAWMENIYEEGVMTCMGMIFLAVCYLFSLLLSCSKLKNHELAIETSLLLQEDKRLYGKPEKELLIILPVKNEEKNIRKVLEQLARPEIREIADILCINDASTDSSGQIMECYPCTQIKNVFGLGYGSALQLGYKYAVRKNYQYVIQMDADGQHDVCNIPFIYEKLRSRDEMGRQPDLVLASRFMEGSSEFPVSVFKRVAFWLFRTMILAATGRRIADPTTGLQGLGRNTFTYYSHYNNFDYQYPDANMIMQMLLLQYQLVEIPAVMHARTDGKSMHAGIEPIWYMVRMFCSVTAVVLRVKVLKMG